VTAAPPHSLEAEESVIGGVLVHARKFTEVAASLKADDFYHPALRAIYEAMVELDGASRPIDSLTVVEQMRSLGTADKLRAFGGADYLTELMAKVVTAENLGYHARIVRSKAKRRQWVERLRQVVALGYGDGADDEFFGEAERAMLEVAIQPEGETDVRHIKAHLTEFANELGERVKRRKEGRGSIVGIATGFERLDYMLSGLRDGKVYVVAARPAMGKSALSWTIGAHVAAQGVAVLDFSLEMSGQDLVERGVAGEARIDSVRLSQGDLEERGSSIVMWSRLTRAVGVLASRPISICERTDLDVMQIRSIARRWRMGLPPGTKALVKVDYMQLVKAVRRKGQQQNREQDVSEISRGLKLLARELACPVMALSQLNRGLEARADKRPMLSDLRESGSIEQDADVVAFIYRDEVYSKEECKDEDKGVAEIIVSKQRNGPTGTVRLAWVGAWTRFEELSNREEP
jgi:replicative DNA helicase